MGPVRTLKVVGKNFTLMWPLLEVSTHPLGWETTLPSNNTVLCDNALSLKKAFSYRMKCLWNSLQKSLHPSILPGWYNNWQVCGLFNILCNCIFIGFPNHCKFHLMTSGSIATTHDCTAVCRCLCLEAHALCNSGSLYIYMVSSFLPVHTCLKFSSAYIIYSSNCIMSYFLYSSFMNTILVLKSGQPSKRTITLIFQLQSFMSVWVFSAHIVPGACSFIFPWGKPEEQQHLLLCVNPVGARWLICWLLVLPHVCQATFWPSF